MFEIAATCPRPGGGTRSENCWGCAAGHWKLDPKRSREKWYFGAKKIEFCEDLYPKDRICVGGWEKTPQKDRARSCQSEKRGSKPRHICITHHIGSTPPGVPGANELITWVESTSASKHCTLLHSVWMPIRCGALGFHHSRSCLLLFLCGHHVWSSAAEGAKLMTHKHNKHWEIANKWRVTVGAMPVWT